MKRAAPDDSEEHVADVKVTADGSKLPNKRYFRTRVSEIKVQSLFFCTKQFSFFQAHCNPLSHNDGFKYPISPESANWDFYYPNVAPADRTVRHVDVGMGYGGLTIALATLFPNKLVLGMEIRAKVCEYVRLKIEALRNDQNTDYQNAACIRTNCMRYMPNFFVEGLI